MKSSNRASHGNRATLVRGREDLGQSTNLDCYMSIYRTDGLAALFCLNESLLSQSKAMDLKIKPYNPNAQKQRKQKYMAPTSEKYDELVSTEKALVGRLLALTPGLHILSSRSFAKTKNLYYRLRWP